MSVLVSTAGGRRGKKRKLEEVKKKSHIKRQKGRKGSKLDERNKNARKGKKIWIK